MIGIELRRATAKDTEFALKSWLDSNKMSHTAGALPVEPLVEGLPCACGRHVLVDRSYWPTMEAALGQLMARPGFEIWVAAVPDEAPPDDIYGWIAVERDVDVPSRVRIDGLWQERFQRAEQPVVHYIFVKQAFRVKGHPVARALFQAAGVDPRRTFFYTFSSGKAAKLTKRERGLVADARFDPRLARFPKTSP